MQKKTKKNRWQISSINSKFVKFKPRTIAGKSNIVLRLRIKIKWAFIPGNCFDVLPVYYRSEKVQKSYLGLENEIHICFSAIQSNRIIFPLNYYFLCFNSAQSRVVSCLNEYPTSTAIHAVTTASAPQQ